ncbi:hypothetical protein LSCM4_01836 [Leishmania orientalis]|uniref:Uncharacterized protein n=1 Tax=Leishmania orientalis TaxID=2249476 RepID=A0A836GC47_9TRYP|nr:hypothetical protein LSCM4_01836 [Leishmania orientalis]
MPNNKETASGICPPPPPSTRSDPRCWRCRCRHACAGCRSGSAAKPQSFRCRVATKPLSLSTALSGGSLPPHPLACIHNSLSGGCAKAFRGGGAAQRAGSRHHRRLFREAVVTTSTQVKARLLAEVAILVLAMASSAG